MEEDPAEHIHKVRRKTNQIFNPKSALNRAPSFSLQIWLFCISFVVVHVMWLFCSLSGDFAPCLR